MMGVWDSRNMFYTPDVPTARLVGGNTAMNRVGKAQP